MCTVLPRTAVLSVVLLSLFPLALAERTEGETTDLAFFEPWFDVEKKDRDTLAQRGVVVRGLPASHKQLSVMAACAVEITPDAFAARTRDIGIVNRRELVSGRFGEPPALDDLRPLTLDQGDIDRLRLCRPGECSLNLADHEMTAVQGALALVHVDGSGDVQEAFRRVVLDRLRRYQSGGLAALPEYNDRSEPVRPATIFSQLLLQTPYLKTYVPPVASYLEQFPVTATDGTGSSVHWSKVTMNGKAVVMVTHLTTFRPEPGPRVPAVLVTSTQVYASRYMNGELALWMLFAGGEASPSYLVYVNRSQLDTLGGTFGGLKRAAIEGRIKEKAASALAAVRDRLERRP
jgi:hypothetical protein